MGLITVMIFVMGILWIADEVTSEKREIEDKLKKMTLKAEKTEKELKILVDFTRDVEANWDCDQDAHKHGTPCRCCQAKIALAKIGIG